MSVSLSQTPAHPTVKTKALIAFSLSGGGNFVRLWCTAAPEGSPEMQKLSRSATSRIEVFSGDSATKWEFAPELGGVYVFAVQEYRKGATVGFRGGYKGDPRGFDTETKIGSESTSSIAIGQRLTSKLGAGPDTATLVLWGFGDTIYPTTFDVHGETSPAIVDPSTPKAKTAAADPTVIAAVAALATLVWSSAMTPLANTADNIIQKFTAHLSQATVHNANDGLNIVKRSYESASSSEGMKKTCAQLLFMLDRHMRNDNGDANGTGGAAYHQLAGVNKADWAAALVAQAPGDIAGCVVALADAWRAFEAHRVNAGVHTNPDNTNTLTPLSPLLALHKAFLVSLQASSPTVPNTANASVVGLVSGAGFKEG